MSIGLTSKFRPVTFEQLNKLGIKSVNIPVHILQLMSSQKVTGFGLTMDMSCSTRSGAY